MDIDGLEGARVAEMIYRRRVARLSSSSSLNIQKWNFSSSIVGSSDSLPQNSVFQIVHGDDDEKRVGADKYSGGSIWYRFHYFRTSWIKQSFAGDNFFLDFHSALSLTIFAKD